MFNKINFLLICLLLLPGLMSCAPQKQVGDALLTIEFNNQMHSRIISNLDGRKILGDFRASETAVIDGNLVSDFVYEDYGSSSVSDDLGNGTQVNLKGTSPGLDKKVIITLYDNFPATAVFQVKYTNTGESEVSFDRWDNNQYQIKTKNSSDETAPFWSYNGASYESRPDWILPLKPGFSQQNFMGMNATDYGGGTPVSDVWNRDAGLAVGHLELVPRIVSLPVTMPDAGGALVGISRNVIKKLKPGESLETFKTFVTIHQGDYYKALATYRTMMIAAGIEFQTPPETSYEPIWCAWGYGRNFTMKQIYQTLPKAKELGYQWAVLDDGFHTAEGDWYLLKSKFPRGDSDMKKLVDTIHKNGLKAKLWWAPLAVDPGTDLIKEHPEYLLLNEDGSTQDISWWNAYYLCPASKEVRQYTRDLVKKIMVDWGYDGLKIDGQHLNGAPPCYNPAHNHASPEESFEKVPEFFSIIYETAMEINPEAVVEICPCGATYAFHTTPFMNQPVSSDPESSWQIRLKGKTLKALMGPSTPYYGDHVELSDERSDFASSVGIGAVIGTKFTWPVGAKKGSKIDLTAEKEKIWKKWTDIYLDKMLPKGDYQGTLYDIAYDKPETHAISKDGRLYYAFYAEAWQGEVELRGLDQKRYMVKDYVNDKEYGTVEGPAGKIQIDFSKYLLLEAVPQ